MYSYDESGNDLDSYHRSVRERANASLHDLEDVLAGKVVSPNTTLTAHAKTQLKSTVNPRTLNWYEDSGRPKKYKDAVSQLSNILSPEKQEAKQSPRMPMQRGPLPTPEEAAALLQTQTSYIHQLENENRFIKDELFVLRSKLSEVVDENSRLHDELKKSVLQEILGFDGDVSKFDDTFPLDDEKTGMFHSRDIKNLQIELERLSALHKSRTERLEYQLDHCRGEIQKYEQMVEDLRSQLRIREVIPTKEDGWFGDVSVLTDNQRVYHQQTIDRLTKERDELMDHVASLKGRVHEMTGREEEAYQQVKKGIELVEEAQFEQTQAMVQREQLAEELNNMRQRFDAHINDAQIKMQEDRDMIRNENTTIVDELNGKIKELNQQNAAMSIQTEKLSRDKIALVNELDEVKVQLRRYDKEQAMYTDTFRAESTNSSLQKNQARQEANRLRKDLEVLQRAKDQEKSQLQTELDEVRRRLNKAERELVNSKEECIHLTSTTQTLERELHLAKLARDSVERGRNEDLKAMASRAQSREEELNSFIEDVEEKHARTAHDMDVMIKRQNRLIGKLREECKRQAGHIEKMTKKNRNQCGTFKRENEELRMRLERAVTRLQDLENTGDQHSRIHEKMKERLKMMDDNAQSQSQQILDLLADHSKLNRDRQLLAREVEFLRKEIAHSNEEDLKKFFSSNKALVDEILSNVTAEEKQDHFLPSNVKFNDEIVDT